MEAIRRVAEQSYFKGIESSPGNDYYFLPFGPSPPPYVRRVGKSRGNLFSERCAHRKSATEAPLLFLLLGNPLACLLFLLLLVVVVGVCPEMDGGGGGGGGAMGTERRPLSTTSLSPPLANHDCSPTLVAATAPADAAPERGGERRITRGRVPTSSILPYFFLFLTNRAFPHTKKYLGAFRICCCYYAQCCRMETNEQGVDLIFFFRAEPLPPPFPLATIPRA